MTETLASATTPTAEASAQPTAKRGGIPSRLHHNAYVTTDMEATRHFYEDLINLPLIATWCEADELYGAERVYCHTFYGMGEAGSGGSLAFFQFAEDNDLEEFKPVTQPSAFVHIALCCDAETQAGIQDRLAAEGYGPDDFWTLDHGYCVSTYIKDPNGLLLEFTVDSPGWEEIAHAQLGKAHQELKRWLAGDHSNNNPYR